MSSPRTTAKQQAIAAEQQHLTAVHARVEHLRRRADARAMQAGADRSGSTFQARFERDVTAHHHASRAARFTFGDIESLAFGRLDLTDADTLHIGRVSVVDEDGEVLLVDWRAPASAAFYQATAADPMDVVRRRTLVTRGQQVLDLDDELLDAEAADRLGLAAVTGQGALLAALSRARTGQMRDIVATIQADQDRIIRTAAAGTLIVSGGPGTGKTVVALHRVAYLLYGDRERFEGRGVLVVGPSRAFTAYTARVLPALGEDRVVQQPLAAFAPIGADADGWDDLDVAELKGRLAWVALAPRLVAATRPPLPPETRVSFKGTTVEVTARDLTRLRDRLLERLDVAGERTYHARTEAAERALAALLWRRWRDRHRLSGSSAPDEPEDTDFAEVIADSAAVTMLRRCFWPPATAVEVLGTFARGEADLAVVAEGQLSDVEVARLQDAWAAAEGWTIDDVAVLDELDALLGPPPSPGRARRRPGADEHDQESGITLTSDRLRVDVDIVDVTDPAYRDFAHVVVDEAQDLSPLQWRMVARRGPYASWTVVGDLAQRSRDDDGGWPEIARLIGRREITRFDLTVNYRTPSEIAALAREVLRAAGRDPHELPQAVREVGERPRLVRTARLLEATAAEVLARLEGTDGTLAVIAPPALLGEVRAAVEAALDTDAPEQTPRVVVYDARTAKGLEFDDVVVVAPEAIIVSAEPANDVLGPSQPGSPVAPSPGRVGLRLLYVAVTRATRRLSLVTGDDSVLPGQEHCEVVEA